MVTTDKTVTETTEKEVEGETKQRTRINPRTKMVKALYSILGENVRENDFEAALDTISTMRDYILALSND